MEKSFHYFGTYCAAYLAGYSHEESLEICYSAQLVDHCSKTFLKRIGGPLSAATTQLTGEMTQMRFDVIRLMNITRIWASFHFLPYDLSAPVHKGGKQYRNKHRMICGPNSDLLVDTVNLAQDHGMQAAGLAMHVLADTWAHRYFAGTPSFVINNTNRFFVELLPSENEGVFEERPVKFKHNPRASDDLEAGIYMNSAYQPSDSAVRNLGHGRAGHLHDYSVARYRYVPAWADYEEVLKDNPAEYYQAFCQMVYALKCLRGINGPFRKDMYDTAAVAAHESRIKTILQKRQLDDDACRDWRAFGEELSGRSIGDFELDAYDQEYLDAPEGAKNETFLGRFILAALAQKGMVVNRIYASGNPLAGRSVDYDVRGFAGMKDFLPLIDYLRGGGELG